MKYKVVQNQKPKLVKGEDLKHGNIFSCNGDLMMVVWDKERYCGQYTSYGTVWCVQLNTYELTYINEEEYYHLYEQVGNAEFRPLYE